MSEFQPPAWFPQVEPGTRILISGATGGLGRALVKMLLDGPDCVIGAHGGFGEIDLSDERIIPIRQAFSSEADCLTAVDKFIAEAGGIDALVVLSGGIHFKGHWKDAPAEAIEKDLAVNLTHPFYLARCATAHMTKQGTGGKILLTGTESALHGGSSLSFPYAIAKRGTECMVQGLAREGAENGILVNGIRMGYITSGFHQRWLDKGDSELEERRQLVPLKRGGHPDEAAALMIYLLSGWAGFITGQMIPLTGGDWL